MSDKSTQFDWDQWNIQKNELKHGVSCIEAESVFYDDSHKLFRDEKHSTQKEPRYIMYGKSLESRVIMVGFTVRKNRIRIITARPVSKKERAVYES